MKDTDENMEGASSSLKNLSTKTLDEMWQYILTTSAVPKLLEKYEKDRKEPEARIDESGKD